MERVERNSTKQPMIGRADLLRAGVYALIIASVNLYICRELFSVETAPMASMHGFWIALAKLAGPSWFRPQWWPFWDCGMPFELTYSPLVPGLMAAWSALGGISHALAFDRITAIVLCLAPLTLFAAAWLMTRAPGTSFAAAMVYSLSSPEHLIVPDPGVSVAGVWGPRRLLLASAWDDTPHLLALVFLPLTILFLSLSIRTRRPAYYAAAAISIFLGAMASPFGVTATILAAICLVFVLCRETLAANIMLTIGIGALAYCMSAAFLPPSVLAAMRNGANIPERDETGWTAGSLTAIALIILGWTILWRFLPRWTPDWRLQFFALFAYLTATIPMLKQYLDRQFFPQPGRYKLEMEFALAWLLAFACARWFARMPPPIRRAAVFLLLALACEQVIHERQFAKKLLRPGDLTNTVERRASLWTEQNLPGVRILMPGSIAQWANAFAAIPQLTGSSWSIAQYRVRQFAFDGIFGGNSARDSILWLKAFGTGAIAVSAKDSAEYWKPFEHPEKFEGVLPALWRQDGVTIYKIPSRSDSLAHVVPRDAIVQKSPQKPEALESFVAALDDPSLPVAEGRWDGRNRFLIRTSIAHAEAISIQISYHPGWRAHVNGRAEPIHRDGLGLMWLEPHCSGDCQVQLDYNGGTELNIFRWISYAAIFAVLIVFPVRRLFKHTG